MKNTKVWRTTEADFRVFRDECRRIQKKWGLIWTQRLPILHRCTQHPEALAATRQWNAKGTVWPDQAIVLNRRWNCRPTRKQLRSCARHEMTHVFLAPLGCFAREKKVRNRVKWADCQEHLLMLHLLPTLFRGERATWQLPEGAS